MVIQQDKRDGEMQWGEESKEVKRREFQFYLKFVNGGLFRIIITHGDLLVEAIELLSRW